jgi:hypothetical protein
MAPGNQPPIGILLCTQKNHELVEYALADMSKHDLRVPLSGAVAGPGGDREVSAECGEGITRGLTAMADEFSS